MKQAHKEVTTVSIPDSCSECFTKHGWKFFKASSEFGLNTTESLARKVKADATDGLPLGFAIQDNTAKTKKRKTILNLTINLT